jgi:predicted GNAT superfamily acetyltransferase
MYNRMEKMATNLIFNVRFVEVCRLKKCFRIELRNRIPTYNYHSLDNCWMSMQIKILEQPDEMLAVEALQEIVWPGSERDILPGHILLAIAHNGGLVIGAFEDNRLVGFVCSFPGLEQEETGQRIKHTSHELGVLPGYRNRGVGFALKRAQWQMVRHQKIDLITWTYDPLLSRNANLNIQKLGAISNQYFRDFYGSMRDGLNRGIPSDRFKVNWWVNSARVENHLSRRARRKLDLAHYLAADVAIVNPTELNSDHFPVPGSEQSRLALDLLDGNQSDDQRASILLIEIPAEFPALRNHDLTLAADWRQHTRQLFEAAFSQQYLVTDFVYLQGSQPRSFYVLSKGDMPLGGISYREG